MPEEDVVRRFKQLGGEFVTVGSDAHYAKDIGAGVDVGMEIAQRSGFRLRDAVPEPPARADPDRVKREVQS